MTKEEILSTGYIEDYSVPLKSNIPRASNIIYEMFNTIYKSDKDFYSDTVVERYNKIEGNIYLEKIIKPGCKPIYAFHEWQDKNCIYIAPYINKEILEVFKWGYYGEK